MAKVFLNENLSKRQGLAALIGFCGTLIILRPGMDVFQPASIIPLLAALIFAAYNILSKFISSSDALPTSILYVAGVGAACITLMGIYAWVTPTWLESLVILSSAIAGVLAQILLMQALNHTTATALQPFNYTLLFFATCVGVFIFDEPLGTTTALGAALVVMGGLYSLKPNR